MKKRGEFNGFVVERFMVNETHRITLTRLIDGERLSCDYAKTLKTADKVFARLVRYAQSK